MKSKTKTAKFVRKVPVIKSKPVSKGKAKAKAKRTRVNNPKWEVTGKIVWLDKTKTNPRKKGSPPWKRFEVLRKANTVGAFLKVLPKWRATISRAVNEKLIKVA